jgi:hypothetical protein
MSDQIAEQFFTRDKIVDMIRETGYRAELGYSNELHCIVSTIGEIDFFIFLLGQATDKSYVKTMHFIYRFDDRNESLRFCNTCNDRALYLTYSIDDNGNLCVKRIDNIEWTTPAFVKQCYLNFMVEISSLDG